MRGRANDGSVDNPLNTDDSLQNQFIDGRIWILLAATLWGTTGTSQALAPEGATPLAVGTMRLVLGGAVLMLVALQRGHIKRSPILYSPLMLATGVSTALYQLTFFAGVALTGVAVGTLVGIGSAPLFAGMLGALFKGEKLGRRWFIATGLAVAGCGLLVMAGDASMVVDPLGILLSLGAGLSYAIFTLFSSRLVQQIPSDAAMAVSFGIGAALMIPTLFFVDTSWMVTSRGIVMLSHLGILATGLAYVFFGRGVRTVPVSVVGTLTLAEPLTAATLGILLLGERLTGNALIGLLILFCGLMVLVLPRRKSVHERLAKEGLE